MLEFAVGFGICFVIAKIADADNRSAATWFFITMGLCVLSMVIPIPILRFAIMGAVKFAKQS